MFSVNEKFEGLQCDNCDEDTVIRIYLRDGILYLCEDCMVRLSELLEGN
jgi:hypothetical protein